MKDQSYTRKEVSGILGITERTVHYYTDEGLVVPGVDNPRGKGTTRRYSKKNLLEFLVVHELAGWGLKLDEIKTILLGPRLIGSDGFDPWEPDNMKTSDSRYYLLIKDREDNMKSLVVGSVYKNNPLKISLGDFTNAHILDLNRLREKIIKKAI